LAFEARRFPDLGEAAVAEGRLGFRCRNAGHVGGVEGTTRSGVRDQVTRVGPFCGSVHAAAARLPARLDVRERNGGSSPRQ
jgi:hypothetical protein